MTQSDQLTALDSLQAWWALAGVDAAVDENPCIWLKSSSAGAPFAVPAAPANDVGGAGATPVPSPQRARVPMPETLDAFHAWLETDGSLPESGWIGPRIMPVGAAGAALMVIVDMPDTDDSTAGTLMAGDRGTLFDGMLRAIGLHRDAIYLTGLAIARPPGGIIEPDALAQLGMRMRHHVRLARPEKLLILGERAGKAMVADGAPATAAPGLQSFNHDGGTVAAIVTHHPRVLLRQPSAKADAWAALQILNRGLPS